MAAAADGIPRNQTDARNFQRCPSIRVFVGFLSPGRIFYSRKTAHFARGDFGNRIPRSAKNENDDTREAPRISRFRLAPLPPGRCGIVSFGIISFVGYWYISGERGNFGKWETQRYEKHQKTRKPGRKLKFIASVGFPLLPRPRGRVGFVSFRIISFVGYWYIRGDFGKWATKRCEKTP